MPNDIDFSLLINIQKTRVKPNGWIDPLYVEYGTSCDDIKPNDTNYFSGVVFD